MRENLFKVVILVAIIGLVFTQAVIGSSEPKVFVDGNQKIKSSTFLTSVEVRVDSLVIPAGTVGKLRELTPNGKGGVNVFVFTFPSKNGKEVSLRFTRKELVEKRPTKNPKSFILNGEAEFYENKNYRAKKTMRPLSIPEGTECLLLVK